MLPSRDSGCKITTFIWIEQTFIDIQMLFSIFIWFGLLLSRVWCHRSHLSLPSIRIWLLPKEGKRQTETSSFLLLQEQESSPWTSRYNLHTINLQKHGKWTEWFLKLQILVQKDVYQCYDGWNGEQKEQRNASSWNLHSCLPYHSEVINHSVSSHRLSCDAGDRKKRQIAMAMTAKSRNNVCLRCII